MSRLIAVCGPPAVGKTTLTKQWESEGKGVRVSPDDFRQGSNPYSSFATKAAFRKATERTKALLRTKQTVLFDSCVLTDKARWSIYTLGKQAGAEVRFVLLDEPYEVLEERNAGRERVVPDELLRSSYQQFQRVRGNFPQKLRLTPSDL